MPLISDHTIAQLRTLHTSAMMDECELLTYFPGGVDQYNMPEPPDYVHMATVPFLFKPTGSGEAMESTEVPILDGTGRFDQNIEQAYDLTLDNLDRLKLTKLHGETLATPEYYEIAGELRRDHMAIIVPLKKVTDEEVTADE